MESQISTIATKNEIPEQRPTKDEKNGTEKKTYKKHTQDCMQKQKPRTKNTDNYNWITFAFLFSPSLSLSQLLFAQNKMMRSIIHSLSLTLFIVVACKHIWFSSTNTSTKQRTIKLTYAVNEYSSQCFILMANVDSWLFHCYLILVSSVSHTSYHRLSLFFHNWLGWNF